MFRESNDDDDNNSSDAADDDADDAADDDADAADGSIAEDLGDAAVPAWIEKASVIIAPASRHVQQIVNGW